MEKHTSAPNVDPGRVDQAPHAATTVPPKEALRKPERGHSQAERVTVGQDAGASPAELDTSTTDGAGTRSSFFNYAKGVLTWAPPNCRYDPKNPPKFGLALNLLFALVSSRGKRCMNMVPSLRRLTLSQTTTVTVANLYYVQPILFKIADTFHVSFERASSVATLLQAGYAAGLLFLCPLGDVFPRRPYILLLVLFTATLVSPSAHSGAVL